MNLEHHPQVAVFLNQLSCTSGHELLFCPMCGHPVSVDTQSGTTRSAICSHCDFHATVPQNHISA